MNIITLLLNVELGMKTMGSTVVLWYKTITKTELFTIFVFFIAKSVGFISTMITHPPVVFL